LEDDMNESERLEILEEWKKAHAEGTHDNVSDSLHALINRVSRNENIIDHLDRWLNKDEGRLDALENREPVGEKEDLIHYAAYNGQTHSIDELSAEQYSTIDRLIRNIKIEVYALGYNAGKLEGNLAERKLGREQEKADVLRFFADIGPQYRGDGRPGFMYEIEGNKHRGLK